MSDNSIDNQTKINGVVIGVITGIGPNGSPIVAYSGNNSELPVMAKATVIIDSDAIGREAALLFEGGDITKPIIMGLIHNKDLVDSPTAPESANTKSETARLETSDTSLQMWPPDQENNELIADGERVFLRANQELILKCGKSSITLTKAGKVIIRGAYISTRSSGANRIKGGSVQIN